MDDLTVIMAYSLYPPTIVSHKSYILSMGKTLDFGTEPEQIVQLFKSDYGREPKIWEILEKARNLTEAIAAKQGTSPSVAAPEKPPTVAPVKPPPQPTTPNPPTSNVGGLA